LKQAQRNAQDGISLIQTAEGALNETHAILQRMRELAVQASNQTNNDSDLGEIQKEVNQLVEEINRIATDTEFNTKQLLGGDLNVKFHIGANEGQNIDLAINNMSADALGVSGSDSAEFGSETVAITAASGSGASFKDGIYDVVAKADYKGAIPDDSTLTGAWEKVDYVMVDGNGKAVAVSDIETGSGRFYAIGGSADNAITEVISDLGFVNQIEIKGGNAIASKGITDHELETGTYTIKNISNDATYGAAGAGYTVGLVDAEGKVVGLGYDTSASKASETVANTVRFLDVNDTSKVLLDFGGAASGLLLDRALAFDSEIVVTGAGIDVSSQPAADKAISTIQSAIETVSAERSKLGAYQNRLEHTISNLGTSAENLQAAESRIRDLDMAEEIMAFTKNNILQQAATAMLAQANMAPQSVLQLLG